MFPVLCFLLLVIAALPSAAAPLEETESYEERLREEGRAYIDCHRLGEARPLCERLETARARALLTPLRIFSHAVGKQLHPYREFVLVAYDPLEERFHDILLAMPVAVGRDLAFQPILRTEGYAVKRLRGQSLNKMVFDVRYDDRELLVYGAKHLLFTKEKLHPLWGGRVIDKMEEVVYLATPPHLVQEELARQGQALFMQAIDFALHELRVLQVGSRARPGVLVGDLISSLAIANLLVAEQTDPCFLEERPKGCEKPIPVRPYASDDQVRQAVNVEFAVNGLTAFRYLRSTADARGALQFTDNQTKQYQGTYTAMRVSYPRARLDPDFGRGTKSLINLAKAAALLIDYELSNRQLPDWVREAALHDGEFITLIVGSAYNGGPTQSKRLADFLEKFMRSYKLGLEDLQVERFPWQDFKRRLTPGVGLKSETLLYLHKIIENWWHLRRHGPKIHPELAKGELA